MKHFFLSFAIIGLMLLGACTNERYDDEPEVAKKFDPVEKGIEVQGDVDFDIFSRYEGDLEEATYGRVHWELYNKDEQSKGKWERITGEFEGGGPDVPANLILSNGKAWEPMTTFTCATGPTAFGTALNAVNTRLRKEYSAYVARAFTVDKENCVLQIGTAKYGIAKADNELFVLSLVTEYLGGRTHNGGFQLEFGFYTKAAPLKFDDGKNLGFDSEVEAYDWLIEQFRATFGEVVNLNGIVGAILDQPNFYLSTLIEERNRVAQSPSGTYYPA